MNPMIISTKTLNKIKSVPVTVDYVPEGDRYLVHVPVKIDGTMHYVAEWVNNTNDVEAMTVLIEESKRKVVDYVLELLRD